MAMPPKVSQPPKPAQAHDRDPIDAKRFPNLAAARDLDRAQHIQRAMANGLTRKQAEKHADEELAEHDD
jgi:predicted transcriptional regulator